MNKKATLLLTYFLIASLAAFSQQKPRVKVQDLERLTITNNSFPSTTPAYGRDKCGFAAEMNAAISNGFNNAAYERELQRLVELRKQVNNFGPPTTIYTVPVIFHIVYDGNTDIIPGMGSNISQLRVNAQIEQLNKDFADLSNSTYGVAEDMGVRFIAAKTDQSGNLLCEPGIERINWRDRSGWSDPTTLASTTQVNNHFRNIVKPQSIWDPYQYLNIWTGNFSASGLLGVATFPALSTLPGLDNAETDLTAGVVVLSGSVGSLTTPGTASPYQYGRTLTHELGHFFGLRHITGDSNCGDDYCGDTPPQDELTGGCPAPGTLNGCSPSVPKMFQNYMDYSNDICLNTFTLNQSERCQVVMLNSPRRKELINSTKGNSTVPNRVFFRTILGSIPEAAPGTCPRFKDFTITLGVDIAASGNATVALAKAGTASDGLDYSILNNSVSYTAGETANKTFTLRVFDDAVVEGPETIQLSLNITGTGVQDAAACPAQFTITITDDDFLQEVNNTTPVITLLSENFGTTIGSNQIPSGWTTSSTSVNQWVGNSADAPIYGFNGNTLHISDGNNGAVNAGTAPMNYSLSATTDARAFTPALPAEGLKNISISFNAVSNGERDADGVYDYGLVYYSLDGSNFTLAKDASDNSVIQGISTITPMTFYVPSNLGGTNSLRVLFRWISDNSIGSQPPFAIDDVVITGQTAGVESQLGHSSFEQIPASVATTFFSTNDKQIISRVQNSSESVPCVTATILSAGNSLTSVNTTAGSFLRTQKVIGLNPFVPNSSANYQATFYFTTAELAAWGSDVPNLKIMKVRSGVSLAGTLTGADAQVVPAVVADFRATKGYASFTGNFSGGFGQFFLVSPAAAVPVTLISFDAKANTKNISLGWTTSMEINNRGFVIERSTNGTDFEKIGWSDGRGNSTIASNYQFTDNFVQPGVLYYYRLRQSDFDGRETISETRQARIKGNGLIITVSPNPATDLLRLFTSGYSGTTQVSLINAKGQVLLTWNNLNTSVAPQVLDISVVPAGVYLLQVRTKNSVSTEKIIVQ